MELLTTQRLHELGYSNHEILQEVRGGRLTRVARGAFTTQLDADARARHLRLARAAAGRCGADTVVSHLSAAVLHGLPVLANDLTERVEVTREGHSGAGPRRCTHLRVCSLRPDEIVMVEGIAVTSVARTVIDVGRTRGFVQAVVVGDAARRAGLGDDSLRRALADARRRPGARAAARAADFLDARSESPGESWSRALMHLESLPPPTLQRTIRDEYGRFMGRPDFVWEELRTLGEFDGRAKYGRELSGGQPPEEVVHQEKRREDALRSLGWSVARWTWQDLSRPGAVATVIRRAFATAAPRLLGTIDPDRPALDTGPR